MSSSCSCAGCFALLVRSFSSTLGYRYAHCQIQSAPELRAPHLPHPAGERRAPHSRGRRWGAACPARPSGRRAEKGVGVSRRGPSGGGGGGWDVGGAAGRRWAGDGEQRGGRRWCGRRAAAGAARQHLPQPLRLPEPQVRGLASGRSQALRAASRLILLLFSASLSAKTLFFFPPITS